ncbi:ferric reductase-like transmembrane domain-containing protein [Candidatus Azambacteria bacterium]|nr:ferric reductase-like transmembrane domain-containing protein [Candidatus Azambacteria bacterium]
MSNILKFFLIAIFIFLPFGAGFADAQLNAVVDYGNTAPKDSDFDGLTDKGETDIFKTNPNNPDSDGDGYLDGAEVLLGSDPNDPRSPREFISSQEVQPAQIDQANDFLQEKQVEKDQLVEAAKAVQKEIPWAWYVSRATAIISYLVSFLMVILGIGIYTKLAYKILKSENAIEIHKYLGISLWVFIVIHIISLLFDKYLKFSLLDLLVPFVSNFKPLYLSIGIFAFYAFLAIIISSLFFRFRHRNIWKKLHYLTYFMFWSAMLHGILLGSDTKADFMQNIYWATGIIAGTAVLFRVFYEINLNKNGHRYIVKSIYKPAHDVVSIELGPVSGEIFNFDPGQYVKIALAGKNGRLTEKHPFSIASSPYKKDSFRLGIKMKGKFTRRVAELKEGDEVAVFGPFGDFVFEDRKMQDVVLLAGGIGITPFMNMLSYAADVNAKNNMTLFYSNKTSQDTVFFNELRALAERNKNIKQYFMVTRESVGEGSPFTKARLDKNTLRMLIPNLDNSTFFICGPGQFIDDIANTLLKFGVPNKKIRRELFF